MRRLENKEVVIGVLFLLSAFYAVRIQGLKNEIARLKQNEAALTATSNMWHDQCVDMHTEMREYWRKRCGCYETIGIINKFSEPLSTRAAQIAAMTPEEYDAEKRRLGLD